MGCVVHAVNLNTLRIIRSYAQSVVLQCPTTFYSEPVDLTRVRWINEFDQYTKPDASVAITPANLILTSQISMPLNSQYTYISCGYVTNNYQYVRLGFWQLQYIGIIFKNEFFFNLFTTKNEHFFSLKTIRRSQSK
jgi:hypothetical protein